MRTTLELPDPLFARLKARAAMKPVSLKQLLHDYVEQGLDASDPSASQASRSARDLPMLRAPLQQQNVSFSNAGLYELLES
ncbi:MAG: hypothetical protein AAEC03_03795 [Synechococcus sp.]